MSVPSNLIPTRITQLPDAPVASQDALMLIAYEGASYKIRVGDLLSVAGVPTSRQVIAGTGLVGGGALANNITLSIAPGGVGTTQLSDTGVAAGTYGSSQSVPVFNVDSKGRITAAGNVPLSAAGLVPDSRQVVAGAGLLGGGPLASDVQLSVSFSNFTPLPNSNNGSAGGAVQAARADHAHPAINLSNDSEVDGVLRVNNGGTGNSLVMNNGGLIWSGSDALYVGPVGAPGQVLVSQGPGAYAWGSALIVSDQPANVIYAGPATGSPGAATFRAMVNADLPNSGVTPSSVGSGTKVPVLTINAKGVVTAASQQDVAVSWPIITDKPTTLAGYGITDGVTKSTAVATGTGLSGGGDLSTSRTLSIAPTGVGAGSYGGANRTLTATVNAQGQLTALAEQPIAIANTQVSGLGTASTRDAGVAGGVATLDNAGTVPVAQLPAAVLGAVKYQGTWNAATNTPTLTSSVGVQGYYYVVNVAGNTNLNGATDWRVGDWAIFNGSEWQKIDNTDAVSSVNGYTGTVVLNFADVGAPSVNGTNATGTWGINVSGNAGTATALQTPRAINGTTFSGTADITTATWGTTRLVTIGNTGKSVNGGAAVAWSLAEIGAPGVDGAGAVGTWSINISGNAATATNAVNAASATAVAGGTASQILYQSAAGATAFLPNGTSGQILRSNGTGAPSWSGMDGGTF